jgi:CheY-like chemotaxis protein
MMDTPLVSILIVDDEPPLRELVRSYLEREGWRVLAADGPGALDQARQHAPD